MKKPNILQIIIMWIGIAFIVLLCFNPPTYKYKYMLGEWLNTVIRVETTRLVPMCLAVVAVVVGGFLSTMNLSNDRIKKWVIKYGKLCISFIFLFLLPSFLWFITIDYIASNIINERQSDGVSVFFCFGIVLLFIVWLVFMRFKKTSNQIIAHIILTAVLCGSALLLSNAYANQQEQAAKKALDALRTRYGEKEPKKNRLSDLLEKKEEKDEKPPITLGDLIRQERRKKQDQQKTNNSSN